MAVAAGSQVQILFVAESTYGTLPTQPTMKVLPIESSTLKLSRGTLTDSTLRDDRMGGDVRPGMNKVDGEIKFNHRYGDFDDILEQVCMSGWSNDAIIAGDTMKSSSIEVGYTDIAQYGHFSGLRANTFDMSIKPNALISCTVGFIGKSFSGFSGSTASHAITDYSNEPYDSFTGAIKEGGATSAIITSLDLKMSNNMSESIVLFTHDAAGVNAGNCIISGTLTAQFTDAALFTKFVNGTESSIEFTLGGLTDDKQTWLVPKITYTAADINIPNENELVLSMSWHAQYDSVTGSKLKIVRDEYTPTP